MGQCPSQQVFRCEGNNDMGFKKGNSVISCNAGLPLQHIINLQSGRNQPSTRTAPAEDTFLKSHTPDRNQKCILDPSEVQQQQQQQADELSERERKNNILNNNEDVFFHSFLVATPSEDDADYSRGAVSSSTTIVPDFVSETACSEMTSFSTVTKPIANLDRTNIKSKRKPGHHHNKFRRVNNLRSVTPPKKATMQSSSYNKYNDNFDGDDDVAYYVAQNKRNCQRMDIPYNHPIPEIMSVASDNKSYISGQQQSKEKVPSTQSSKFFENKFFDAYENMILKWGASKDELSVPNHEPKRPQQLQRCMDVLHLKMKAHLGFYYTQRYLPLFPDAPAPIGLSPDNIPENKASHLLVTADTSSSSMSVDSQIIDFGSIPPSTPVTFSLTDVPFMDLAITGSLGLVARPRGHATSAYRKFISMNRNQKSPDHYIVMINRRSGVPLAVCAMKSTNGNPIVRIFACKARVPGQTSAATTKMLGLEWAGNYPLFAWAEIVTDGIYPDPVGFSIYMASGSDGRFSAVPCYKANLDDSNGHPTIKVVGRTDKEVHTTGCAIINVEVDDKDENADGGNHNNGLNKDSVEDLVFKLNIAQGIDPALMICFTAVIDEVMEKSMRLQARFDAQRRRNNRAEF